MEALDALVHSTIPLMPSEFDTHELILKLAQHNQRQYIEALQQVRGDAPFQTLHSMIGKRVLKFAPEFGLTPHEPWSSDDIFRQKNSCVRWVRGGAV